MKILSRAVSRLRLGAAQLLRGHIRFVDTASVTWTLVDDPTNDEVEVQATSSGSGAPADADYLVGTANAGLSAEIVVGTAPGGELGGTWAAPTVDATHSGSAHHAQAHDHTAADSSGVLTNDEHDGFGEYAEIASPATPAANKVRLYAKDDGAVSKLFYKRDDGTEIGPLSGPGGGATITVQADDVTVDAAVTTLDFDGDAFEVTSSPAGEANLALAYGYLVAFGG